MAQFTCEESLLQAGATKWIPLEVIISHRSCSQSSPVSNKESQLAPNTFLLVSSFIWSEHKQWRWGRSVKRLLGLVFELKCPVNGASIGQTGTEFIPLQRLRQGWSNCEPETPISVIRKLHLHLLRQHPSRPENRPQYVLRARPNPHENKWWGQMAWRAERLQCWEPKTWA